MKNLKGKVAVITGAGSGIGKATSLALARQGCIIACCDINADTAATTAKLVRDCGVDASVHRVDVANRKHMEGLPAAVVKAHRAVHIVVNNAGTGVAADLIDHSLDDYEWLVGINLMGVIYGSKVFLDDMKRAGEGHIVNISSAAGIVPIPGMSSYCATKFAVRGFSESIRSELAPHKIGVTVVHPGLIATNIATAVKVVDENLKQKRNGMVQAFERFGRSPDKVAALIVDAIQKNKQRVLAGWEAHLLDTTKRLFPVGNDIVNARLAQLGRR